MATSIRLPFAGASWRGTAAMSGSGAGFSMGLILCLCGGLMACLAVTLMQVQPLEHAVSASAAKDPNARYYPLADCPLFRIRLQGRKFVTTYSEVILPEPPDIEILPTVDLALKLPLHPRTPEATPASEVPGAVK